MVPGANFQALVEAAEAQPLEGWGFRWIEGRRRHTQLPWNYTRQVALRARDSPDLLDMGTGGGEWLSALSPRPLRTVATESYAPNVPVAERRLHPLGVPVVRTLSAPDRMVPDFQAQAASPSHGQLPFRSGSFHLVTNRHESFLASEVARVLEPGGWFVTEQFADGGSTDWRLHLGLPPERTSGNPWGLGYVRDEVESAGLRVKESAEGTCEVEFRDVGAVVYYLRMVPWEVPEDFSVERYRRPLEQMHEQMVRGDPIRIRQSGFWLESQKP